MPVIIIGDGPPVKLLPGESVVVFVGAGSNQLWWNERSAWRARLLRALDHRAMVLDARDLKEKP